MCRCGGMFRCGKICIEVTGSNYEFFMITVMNLVDNKVMHYIHMCVVLLFEQIEVFV